MIEDVTATEQPLRRNRRFQALWIGSTSSSLGLEAADVGYPLAVLALTGSPALAGLFGFVQLTATLLFGLPAGQLVDRYDRRRLLLLSDGIRMLSVASIAAALATDRLTMPHLLVAAAVLGAGGAVSAPARMLVLRAVVPSSQLTTALTLEEVRANIATLLGAPLGGLLFGLRQFLPFVLSAATLLLSWTAVLSLRTPVPPGDRGAERPGWTAGIRVLLADPVMRTATMAVAALNAVGAPLLLITIVLLREQDVPPWQTGVALSGLAIGGLLGARLVRPMHRLRPRTVLLGVLSAQLPVFVLLAAPFGPWWVLALLIWSMLGVPALGVLLDVLIFRKVPDHQRGGVIVATTTLAGLGAPLGTIGAGLLLQYLTPAVALLSVAGFLALAVLYVATRGDLRDARWPEQ